MIFYIIKPGGSDDRAFTYAEGFGPLTEGMPFLTEDELAFKKAFWEINPRGAGLIIGDRGNKWPDFLRNGGSPPTMFISKRIIKSLEQAGVPIARFTEMPIAKIRAKSLKKVSPPDYVVLEATPEIEMDYHQSGVELDSNEQPVVSTRSQPIVWKLKLNTWSGADLFGWPRIPKRLDSLLICSERIVALADQDGWTNVKFEPIEAV